MSRICPACNINLGSYDNYFCSNCGNKLPQEMVSTNPDLRAKVFVPSYLVVKKKFSLDFIYLPSFKKSVAFVFIICVFLFSSFSFIKFYPRLRQLAFGKNNLVKPKINSDMGKQAPLDLDLELKSSLFGSDRIAEYVPEEVILYLEADDLKKFIELYARDSGLGKDLINKIAPLLGDHFAFFVTLNEGEYDWNFIFIPKDEQKLSIELKNTDEKYWNFGIVEGKLVMASNKRVIEDVRLAKNKISLNMSLSTSYVKEKQNLLPKGQVLIILFSDEGVSALEVIKGFKVSSNLINTINRVLKAGSKSLVVDSR